MRIDTARDFSPVHPQEVYRYHSLAVDVCKAWQLIAALTPEERASRAFSTKLPLNLLEVHWVDVQKAMDADLTVPVLVGSFPNPRDGRVGSQVVDGWHRVYKAHQLRKRLLPAFRLTVEETRACTVR